MDCLAPHHEETCPGMTPSLSIISAAVLDFGLYSGGIRLHSIMLHRVLKAHGLGDALCNLPCQYPSLTSTAVKRVLPADWVLLNLKCDAHFPSLAWLSCFNFKHLLPILGSWSTWQKYTVSTPRRCTHGEHGTRIPSLHVREVSSYKGSCGGHCHLVLCLSCWIVFPLVTSIEAKSIHCYFAVFPAIGCQKQLY